MKQLEEMTLDVSQSVEINASEEEVFDQLLLRLTEKSATPDNQPMPMVMEQWPGGRWFRDLGNDQGHLWGFVQVIKPPKLLELSGPMFMSYPAMGHVQFRVSELLSGGCDLMLRHRVVGLIEDDHRKGLTEGWSAYLNDVKRMSE
ncbi:MAG: SRPBCC domain-containing protein [Planctomycetales bacterium]